jgi:hypothetical protein
MACAPDLCACPQGSARATEKPLAYAKENMNIKREDRLHIIEILAIVVIGFFQSKIELANGLMRNLYSVSNTPLKPLR